MVFGCESIMNDFRSSADSGKLGHSYLFFGDKGVGKRMFAASLANFLETGDFRFGDKNKTLIDSRFFIPDEKGIISIDVAREIKKFLSERPFVSSKKTAIIDDSHCLTSEAQSSLLKVVEEPPAHALIVFIAGSAEVLFPPLLSRLSKIYFPRMPSPELEKILTEQFGIHKKTAHNAAIRSFGRIGEALRVLQVENADDPDRQNKTENLTQWIENEILRLRTENLRGSSGRILRLIRKETECGRFNLNPSLQKKAIADIISK
ncbi:hypothetical protein A3D55_00080 [Candidatus Jorgensenbacteria bacterium RIFCSPHIGHO2_02_FULL_45_20]|uniref:AAA+ ATPase domain-containing protein n=2 Tax=Candidatus Joergenseniibacteriota TaxID=1752739 RepID=A0A1F6BQ37_9BACT|nr:MAG: polymerase III, delta prime subunit protein [Candidatus Jorgensenbacteria bacterium GW2011_GWA2_45_9]OGG38647.1 MAG: hypothetical protein A3D55_00080 [Candidatus Jorgensenbacteria bacterium RIFCSPHIGHO2_02_FULL_45_20]